MPKTKASQKAAAQKAWDTLRKRLAKEKREAAASGKAAPPTPAQKASATLRAKKLAREADRKKGEALIKKGLGQGISDIQGKPAEIAAAGQRRRDAQATRTDGGTTNLGQSRIDAQAPDAEIAAAGHDPVDAQRSGADGGTANLGQSTVGARTPNAETAPPAIDAMTSGTRVPAAPPSVQTTMRAALEKAGVNTARVELEQQVKDLLARNNNDPARMLGAFDTLILRRRDLRQVLLVQFATEIAGANAELNEAAEANIAEAKQALQGSSTFKRAPVHHKRTASQKQAARQAMAESLGIWSRKIGERPLGELTWGELGSLRQTSISEAGKHTLAGLYCAADAILLSKILDYAQVRDSMTLVRNVVPEDVLAKMNHEAAKQAPRVIDIGRTAYEGTLTKQIEQRT